MSVVLVVDDDMDIRETIGLLLEDEGHHVVTAAHGEEALRLLRGGLLPDVIILDLMMPVMSGWDFREHMLRDATIPAIPIIVITGDTRPSKRSETLGVAAVLSKPFEPDRLLALIEASPPRVRSGL